MKITFTPKVAYRMIDRAKRIFCRYPCKTISDEWKTKLKNLQVFIVINPKLQVTAGTAGFIRIREGRKLFKIPKESVPTKVDGVLGYFIIEINPKLIILDPPSEVYDTISHELAHCLDFILRGFYGKTEESFHDDFWIFLHKRMGGDGEPFLKSVKFKYQLRSAKPKAKEITENFNPLEVQKLS